VRDFKGCIFCEFYIDNGRSAIDIWNPWPIADGECRIKQYDKITMGEKLKLMRGQSNCHSYVLSDKLIEASVIKHIEEKNW